jgi:hypothetical protein
MNHWKAIIMNIISRMVSMVEKSLIMLVKLKYNRCFSGSQLQSLENKSLLNNFYKKMKWVPLEGTNFNNLIHY